MLEFDHIGIVVDDVDASIVQFSHAIGAVEATDRFDDHGLTVSVRFLRDKSGVVYEMIAPLGDNSVVAASLKKNNNILNQLAYRTVSLSDSVATLKASGHFVLGQPQPAIAFNNASVQFLLSPLGFVMELIEVSDPVHQFFPLALSHSLGNVNPLV